MGPMIDEPATTAAAYFLVYPSFSMLGMNIVPSAETSATAAPVIPAKIMLATMLTYASPPRNLPTRILAKSTSFSVTPAWFIASPATMKNGMAIRTKESMPAKNLSGMIVRGNPLTIIQMEAVAPMATAIGNPTNIRRTRRPK